jgi:hypothetical protein
VQAVTEQAPQEFKTRIREYQLVTQFRHEAREKTEAATRQAILNTKASEILDANAALGS